MTYEQAQEVIKGHERILDRNAIYTDPPHIILGCIISATERSTDREAYIFHECIENHKDNKEVLLALNIISYDLSPYVVVLMRGNNIVIPLESYLVWPPISERQSNP